MKARDAAFRLRGYLRRLVLLLIILYLLIDVRVSLWRLPYARVRARVDRLARRGDDFPDVGAPWRVRWVDRLGRFMPWSTCLVRALTAQILLGRRGVEVDVVFGARLNRSRKFDAHAWVEWHGRILLGKVPELDQYREMKRETVLLGD